MTDTVRGVKVTTSVGIVMKRFVKGDTNAKKLSSLQMCVYAYRHT